MMARAAIAALALLAGSTAAALAQDRIHLHTNEAEIGEVLRDGGVTIDDPLAVFSTVLKNLPERVQVYPTENYFYFRFTQNGVVYSGNIRLGASDRDQGKVNFAYNEQPADWNADPRNRHVVLGPEQGITVEQSAPLTYRVTHSAKTVTFVLNDLSGVKPPPDMLKADETFLGPSFDDSAIRFFLVFNSRLKVFHYILDETTPVADQLIALKGNAPIQTGKRSGFAFYPFDGRKILVGVDERQSRRCAKRSSRSIRASKAGSTGLATLPTAWAANCALRTSKAVPAADRAACFVIDNDEAQRKNPRPLALKRR